MDVPNSTTSTILAVDDTPTNLSVLAELLKDRYRVRVATNGLKALESAAANPPDLILLDVMMPDMDGPSTLRKLRGRDSAVDAPAVFITAKVQAGDMAQYRQLGAFDVIVKPFDPMALPERIGQIWQSYREGEYGDAG